VLDGLAHGEPLDNRLGRLRPFADYRFRFPGDVLTEIAAGSGSTKTRLKGKFDVSALDNFNCTSGTVDPLSWLSLTNNGTWVAKPS
jgi:hypothetical protein